MKATKITNFLKKHIHTIHEGLKDYYKYESCGKIFSTATYLKKHVHIIHEGHKDHKCEFCRKSFSEKHHLKRHINVFHLKSKANNGKCDICDEKSCLKPHMILIHSINLLHLPSAQN